MTSEGKKIPDDDHTAREKAERVGGGDFDRRLYRENARDEVGTFIFRKTHPPGIPY